MDRYGADILRTKHSDAVEPATTHNVKELCGIDFTDDDSLIDRLCVSARSEAEFFCGRVFLKTTVKAFYEYWQGRYELPFGPVVSITSIKDSDNAPVLGYSLRGVANKSIDLDALDGVYLEYISDGCPEDAKVAIEMLAACKYDPSFAEKYEKQVWDCLSKHKVKI